MLTVFRKIQNLERYCHPTYTIAVNSLFLKKLQIFDCLKFRKKQEILESLQKTSFLEKTRLQTKSFRKIIKMPLSKKIDSKTLVLK